MDKSPNSLTEADIGALRESGMSDEEVLHLPLIASYFNSVNRMVSGLGVNLEKEGQTRYKY